MKKKTSLQFLAPVAFEGKIDGITTVQRKGARKSGREDKGRWEKETENARMKGGVTEKIGQEEKLLQRAT